MSGDAAAAGSGITLTARAAEKVSAFLSDQPDLPADQNLGRVALRVAVQAGGCAGFRYALFFDDRQLEGDTVSVQHGVTLRVDGQSSLYLSGVTIDWKESLSASGFSIDNPNASGGCACGESSSF